MTIHVNMHKAKSDLSKLVVQAQAGEEVIITRAGKPVARLVPIRERRGLGFLKGKVWIAPNFDDPLPEEILKAFEGE